MDCDESKIMGLGAPVNYIVEAAWDFGAHRIIYFDRIAVGQIRFHR